jgi:hypothetical protein
MILGVLPKFLDFAHGLRGLAQSMSDQVAGNDSASSAPASPAMYVDRFPFFDMATRLRPFDTLRATARQGSQ